VATKASNPTRRRIIHNARTLLRRHGPDKFTVVDIARSLGMSHANVYRFFKTKTEILDVIIEEWMLELEQFMDAIAERRVSAAARIEAVVLELHRKRKRKLIEDAQVFETYKRLVEVRPDFAARRREKILRVFKRLIDEGIKSGEFRSLNSLRSATVLKDATSLFLHPLLIPGTLNEQTEGRAKYVVRFILGGLADSGCLREERKKRAQISARVGSGNFDSPRKSKRPRFATD
jgi:AcrR family transcriptional regulator